MIAWGQYPIASDPPPIAVADGAGEVIVMTAEGDVETAVRAMKAGADDFIEKPFSDDLLLGAINTAFTRGRGPSRHREGRDAAERVASGLVARTDTGGLEYGDSPMSAFAGEIRDQIHPAP